MNALTVADRERRLLILAPIGKDAELIGTMLRAERVPCVACGSIEELLWELPRGAAAILITEESIGEHEIQLRALLSRQPPWSDLPVLLLTRTGANSAAVERSLETFGNVTLLERPTRIGALASAVRSAVRARERQYLTRGHLLALEQIDRRKDEFLATLAHELRNPLAPIRNAVYLLQHTQSEEDREAARALIQRQVNHMVRLVDDLLDVSRITLGRIELRPRTVDLSAVISSAVETSQPLIDKAGHQLSVELSTEPLTLDGDPTRLAQVFANLLNNAAKYTEPGGQIVLTAVREGEFAVITITDTGIGIRQDALVGVFEIFAQADAHTRHSQGGLGVGLALARSLVALHGGTLTATSPGVGKGSEFTVRLPLNGTDVDLPVTLPTRALASIATLAHQKILMVDDNRDAADTMAHLLACFGAEVRVEYDGEAAINAVEAFTPTTIILDIGMPVMDGYEVAHRLRHGSRPFAGTLIALTGWGQDHDRLRTTEAGFDHHFVKPVDPEEIHRILARRMAPQGASSQVGEEVGRAEPVKKCLETGVKRRSM